jgi:hypothetical protein
MARITFALFSCEDVGYLDYDFTWLHTSDVSASDACRSLSLGGMAVSSGKELPLAIGFNTSPLIPRVAHFPL